jgi:hypothetical protein
VTRDHSAGREPVPARLEALPETIERPSAWIGSELATAPEKWRYVLDGEDIAELESAARRYLASGRDIGDISSASFPLDAFAERLRSLRSTLLHGVGFELIRGLPIDRYTREFAAAIFCGIGAHLGSARSQNAAGHILGHVRNVGADAADVNTRIYQTAERQTFHTDSADVVGLLCLRQARSGGDSLLVSAETIYNRMRRDRPDLLALLFDDVATDRRGEVPEGAAPYFVIPVFNWHAGLLTVMYQRQYIDSAQRFPDAPRLTAQYREALDCLDRLANDPGLHLTMRLEPGDMQFVYNHALLHDRTAFDDWPDPAEQRHLLRLWLSIDGDRPLPRCFAQRYGPIEAGKRGGILTAHTRLHAPIDDPVPGTGA